MKEKVVIITGAANGMGEATALLLAKEGATVIATDIKEEKVNAVAARVQEEGGKAVAYHHDVTNQEGWKKVVEETMSSHGRIDGLVNNAGISMDTPFDQLSISDWDRVMAVNTTSVFFGCQQVIPHMVAGGGGSIVNIASMAALVGNCGSGPYTASKGAVRSLTKAFAHDYAKMKVRCNVICPGYIETAMTKDLFANDMMKGWFLQNTPLPYLGEASDVAYGILFLLSDEAKFITGVELPIDGGIVAG